MERREFLALAAPAAFLLRRTRTRTTPGPLHVAFLYAPDVVDEGSATASGRDGVQLGWEEASQAYGLLGRELWLSEAPERDADAVIAITRAPECQLTAPLLVDARARVPAGPCGADAFRIGVAADAPHDLLLWHPRLERFGAAQLNERFARRFGRPMDQHAWAGWFAMKVVAEAGLRAESVDAFHLREWLRGDRARLDGHKGVALRFGDDQRLVQPLYRVIGDDPVEVPVEAVHAC